MIGFLPFPQLYLRVSIKFCPTWSILNSARKQFRQNDDWGVMAKILLNNVLKKLLKSVNDFIIEAHQTCHAFLTKVQNRPARKKKEFCNAVILIALFICLLLEMDFANLWSEVFQEEDNPDEQSQQRKLLLSISCILDSYPWIMITKLLSNPT